MSLNEKEKAEIERIYNKTERLIYKFFRDYTDDENLIIELSQSLWYKVCTHWSAVSKVEEEGIANYLRVMAKHIVDDHFKGKDREASLYTELAYLKSQGGQIEGEKETEEFLDKEMGDFLEEALIILTKDERDLLKLKYRWRLSGEEIAKILDISHELVRVKLHKIRLKLKEEILDRKRRWENED